MMMMSWSTLLELDHDHYSMKKRDLPPQYMRFGLSEELSQMLEIIMEPPAKRAVKITKKIFLCIYRKRSNNILIYLILKRTLVSISEKEILVESRAELNNLAKFVDDDFIGCNSSVEYSISDCNRDTIFSESDFTRLSICVTMTYQHGINEARAISAPYAYNKCLFNTDIIFMKRTKIKGTCIWVCTCTRKNS